MLDRILSRREVAEVLGVSRSSTWRLQKKDPSFPEPRKISERRVGWLASEVESWLQSRPLVSEQESQP